MNFVLLFSPQGADVHVLIDAISSVMMLEEKDLCKTGELAIAVMRETAFIIMGDLYKVGCSLRFAATIDPIFLKLSSFYVSRHINYYVYSPHLNTLFTFTLGFTLIFVLIKV